jgi:adenosylcobinamide-phosphate synthase
VTITPLELGAAFLLDVIVGDPERLPHPVRGIGRLIATFERETRKIFTHERLAGVLTVLLTLLVTGVVVGATCAAAHHLHPGFGSVVTIAWLYLGLATRSLSDYTRRVYRDLRDGDLERARQSVAHIVGRDTARLDRHEVSRAAIESVSESAVDAVLSPLCFAVLGGPVGLWIFKAVSTCDSMIGHKDARYIRFGTFGARLDDALNYLPARLSLILFPAAAALTGEDAVSCWRVARRDRHHHASPNSGIPEAATAGALRVRLGGPTLYEGELVNKPPFGGEFRLPEPGDIPRAIRLMWAISLLGLCLGLCGLA